MTEVERIINEGIIPVDFLKPEIRCDFLVDEGRKKLWAVCLDLLIKFDAVCKKHKFKYFMTGGSLLGTIRHQGFIPWDDDIDVIMFRDDYDRFSRLASQELLHPYFWQTPETDEGYLYSFNKIRNSRTSAIVKTFRHAGFNQGIWLSIFPIDNCIVEGAEERYEVIKRLNQENSAHMRRNNPHPTEADLKRLAEFPYRDPMEVVYDLQSLATQFNDNHTEYVACTSTTVYPIKNLIRKRSDYNQTIMKNFEGILEVPVPIGFDNILTTQYGNYMEFPPVEERGTWHDGVIFDADVPYLEYLFRYANQPK